MTSAPSLTVVAILDPRDFVSALDHHLLLSEGNSYLVTTHGMEMGFLPGINLVLIPPGSALQVRAFSSEIITPSLTAFDVDVLNSILYLHFSDIMDLSTFRQPAPLTLQNPSDSVSFQLMNSVPRIVNSNHVKTVCIPLARDDLAALVNRSICMKKFSGCLLSFPETLVRNYRGIPVEAVLQTNAMEVCAWEWVCLSGADGRGPVGALLLPP